MVPTAELPPGDAPLTEAERQRYLDAALVRAPVSGTVSRAAQTGAVLAPGDPVAELLEDDPFTNQSELRAYVPAETAAQLLTGMRVRVDPSGSAPEGGRSTGFVSAIGEFPSSQAQLREDLGGFQLPGGGTGDLIEVRVTLADGKPLEMGTVREMTVVLGEASPLMTLLGR